MVSSPRFNAEAFQAAAAIDPLCMQRLVVILCMFIIPRSVIGTPGARGFMFSGGQHMEFDWISEFQKVRDRL